MQKEIEYQVSYDVVATIEYTREENPGEYYFSIKRHWADLLWDDEEDEIIAYVEEGKVVEIEAYETGYVRDEERDVIEKMMEEILANPKVTSHE